MAVKYAGANGINSYPVLPVEGIRQQIVELFNANKSIRTSRDAAKKLVDQKFNSAEHFFLGNYGMTPFESMIKEHLYSPSGKAKGIKSGTAEATAIATSILAYTSPAPPQQLSREKVMLIVSGLIKYEESSNQVRANEVQIVKLSLQSMMKLEAPMPEQLLEVAKSGVLSNTLAAANASTNPTGWQTSGPLSDLGKYHKVNPNMTLDKVLKSKGFTKSGHDYIHSSGLYLTPYLIYNMKSIAGQGGPLGYWSNAARYRLAAMPISVSITEIHLVEVNPLTGAPYRRGKVVARVKSGASDAMATVRQSYPYVDELRPDVNPVLDPKINVNHATSGLNEKAEKWKLIGDKSSRYFVNILETNWIWADIDLQANQTWYNTFKEGRHTRNSKNHTQTQLLNFTSDDPKLRMNALTKGNPPKELNHLLYGGTSQQMKNTFPVSLSKFYLLPLGVEEALERICEDRVDNVVIAYINRKLGGGNAPAGSRYRKISNMTQVRWAQVMKELHEDMQVLLAALTSPYLLTKGPAYTLTGNSAERLGRSFSSAAKSRVMGIFQAAKWPATKPELMFEAPINDEADSQKVYGDFLKAMKTTGGIAPPELSSPELPEMKIQSTPQIIDGQESMVWQLDKGRGEPFNANISAVRSFLTYYNDGKKWYTKFTMRELLHTKNILSRTRVKGHSAEKRTAQFFTTQSAEVQPITGTNAPSNALIAGSLGVTALVGTAVLAALSRKENTDF
jgi:hypothetical protein